jgi:hypothetical protein
LAEKEEITGDVMTFHGLFMKVSKRVYGVGVSMFHLRWVSGFFGLILHVNWGSPLSVGYSFEQGVLLGVQT